MGSRSKMPCSRPKPELATGQKKNPGPIGARPIRTNDSRKARRRAIYALIRRGILGVSNKGTAPIVPPLARCRLKGNGVVYRGPKAIGLVD